MHYTTLSHVLSVSSNSIEFVWDLKFRGRGERVYTLNTTLLSAGFFGDLNFRGFPLSRLNERLHVTTEIG